MNDIDSTDFAIISDNCFSVGVYHHLNSKFTSPFCHTIVPAPDYIKMLQNYETYINKDVFVISFNDSKYKNLHPRTNWMIMLGDIEVHIYHDRDRGTDPTHLTTEDIKKMFERRRERLLKISMDRIVFKFGGVDDLKQIIKYDDYDKLIEDFHSLPFKHKYSFTDKKYLFNNNFIIKEKHRLKCAQLGLDVEEYFDVNKILKTA